MDFDRIWRYLLLDHSGGARGLFNNHHLHDSSQAHCSARPDSCRHARDARSDHGRRPARRAPYLRARPLRLRIRPCGRPSGCGLRALLVRRPGRSPPLRTLRRRHRLSRRACRRRIRAHGAELSRAPSRHASHRRGHRRPQRPHARRGQDAERGEDRCAPRDLHGRRRPFGLDRRTHLASACGPHGLHPVGLPRVGRLRRRRPRPLARSLRPLVGPLRHAPSRPIPQAPSRRMGRHGRHGAAVAPHIYSRRVAPALSPDTGRQRRRRRRCPRPLSRLGPPRLHPHRPLHEALRFRMGLRSPHVPLLSRRPLVLDAWRPLDLPRQHPCGRPSGLHALRRLHPDGKEDALLPAGWGASLSFVGFIIVLWALAGLAASRFSEIHP